MSIIRIEVLRDCPRNLIDPRKAFAEPYRFWGDAFKAATVFGEANRAKPIPSIDKEMSREVSCSDGVRGRRVAIPKATTIIPREAIL